MLTAQAWEARREQEPEPPRGEITDLQSLVLSR